MPSRRCTLGLMYRSALTLAVPSLADPSLAQERFPSRPVRLLVGFPAGGPLDLAGRLVFERVARALGTTAVVENRPGASGMLAAQAAAGAGPDGHVLLMAATANLAISRFLYEKLPYDADRQLRPVAQFATSQNVVYARPGLGIRTLAQLRDWLRASPGRYNYASPGAGTTPHLTMEVLKATDRLYVVHVPFRGSPPALTSVAAGDVEFGVDAVGAALPFVRQGRVVALAQTGERRTAALPDVPTLAELGYRNFPSGTFLGLSAPAGIDDGIVATLEQQVGAVLQDTDVRTRLQDLGMDAAFLGASAFGASIATQLPFWKRAVDYSGAKA